MVKDLSGNEQSIWQRLRALIVFLVKLFIDGFRDVLLFPAAVIVFCLDFIVPAKDGISLFDKLMAFGRGTDKTINLFNQHDLHKPGSTSVDDIFDRLESGLRQEFKSGAVSAQAKEVLDKALDRMRPGVYHNEADAKKNQNGRPDAKNNEAN